MGNIIQLIALIGPLLKLLIELVALLRHPDEARVITQKATKEVQAVKLAANPTTALSPKVVRATLDDHMDEIDDIINSANFQQTKFYRPINGG